METFRLKSMTDFVLEQYSFDEQLYRDTLRNIVNYANFLKQPLKLEMFVPCDEFNILEEPIFHEPNNENEIGNYQILIDEYYEAKEKVLFEGFNIIHEDKIRITIECNYLQLDYFKGSKSVSNYSTIEDLSKLELELTENAIKQIGL